LFTFGPTERKIAKNNDWKKLCGVENKELKAKQKVYLIGPLHVIKVVGIQSEQKNCKEI